MTGSSSPELRPPPPPGLQKSLSRRVSFNESTFASKARRPPSSVDYSVDTESQASSSGDPGRRRTRTCLSFCSCCCVWVSITLAVFLTLFLFVGGIYFAYLQSNLPEVRLHRLDVNKLDVKGDMVVEADFEVRLNISNGNGKFELRYSGLGAAMSASGVNLGWVKLDDMQQQPQGMTDVKVQSVVKNVAAEEASATDLAGDYERRMVLINVVVKGRVDFFLGGRRVNGMPFKIDCHDIDQSYIDRGLAPTCNTRLSLF